MGIKNTGPSALILALFVVLACSGDLSSTETVSCEPGSMNESGSCPPGYGVGKCGDTVNAIIFTQPGCVHCYRLKLYANQLASEHTELNISVLDVPVRDIAEGRRV